MMFYQRQISDKKITWAWLFMLACIQQFCNGMDSKKLPVPLACGFPESSTQIKTFEILGHQGTPGTLTVVDELMTPEIGPSQKSPEHDYSHTKARQDWQTKEGAESQYLEHRKRKIKNLPSPYTTKMAHKIPESVDEDLKVGKRAFYKAHIEPSTGPISIDYQAKLILEKSLDKQVEVKGTLEYLVNLEKEKIFHCLHRATGKTFLCRTCSTPFEQEHECDDHIRQGHCSKKTGLDITLPQPIRRILPTPSQKENSLNDYSPTRLTPSVTFTPHTTPITETMRELTRNSSDQTSKTRERSRSRERDTYKSPHEFLWAMDRLIKIIRDEPRPESRTNHNDDFIPLASDELKR